MKLPLIAALVFLLAASSARPADAIVEPLDREMVQRKKNFGYSNEEIEQYFNVPLVMKLDREGLDRSYLKAPPKPGVHPRLLFNPEDLADIRHRLETTKTGQAVMANIRKHLDTQLRQPKQPLAVMFDRLAAGTDLQDLKSGDVMHTAFITVYEAFRCLIDNDETGGRRVAAVIASLAKITEREVTANVEKEKAKGEGAWMNFQHLAKGPSYQGTLGLMYDFAYNFMAPAQRDTVRQAISVSHAGMTLIGAETLRSMHTNTSNWISWSSRMIFLAAAIEGEPGHDPEAYERVSDAMTGYISAYYDTGEAYEGWGKNFMFFEHLAIMGKRGKDVLAARDLRSVYQKYFLHAMFPWGGGFTFYDSQGGTGSPIARNADLVMYNFFFPKDSAGKFIYRNQIKDDYANLNPGGRVNTTHPFSVTDSLCVAIFANDFDESKSWDQAHSEITRKEPLSTFSEDTCNLITRSSWSRDALYLNYLNRAVAGGHRYADRSHFSLYSHGRFWSIYRPMRQIDSQRRPQNRSVITLAGDGPSTAPARCVAYADAPLATLIATDLSVPWDYRNRVPFSYNYYRLNPVDVPWMNMPISQMPDWQTSLKPVPKPGAETVQPVMNPQVKYAYRTAALVRGSRPYVIISDDIRIADEAKDYQWGMALPNDVVVGAPQPGGAAGNSSADVVLTEKSEAAPGRRLLVRILDSGASLALDPPRAEEVVSNNPPQPDVVLPRFVIPSKAVDPRYRVLLFPHVEGDELPTTRWNADKSQFVVEWKDQKDTITFTPHEDNRTRLSILRDGRELLKP